MISTNMHRIPMCAKRPALAAAVVALSLSLMPLTLQAQTYTVLYNFTGKPNDGAFANGSLTQDKSGNLYGTTADGGLYDFGSAFKVDSSGNETILTNFDFTNVGISPQPGMIRHKNILYGTANGGGYYNYGSVFNISDKGRAKLLYSFCSLPNCADGYYPLYGVMSDSSGNLYGETNGGGAYGVGAIFKVDPTGNETVLYSFCPNGEPCSDGSYPGGEGIIMDSADNLYGEAEGGSYYYGVVWKLDTSGNESVLHTFTGGADGGGPVGTLARDKIGNLYGVTYLGGSGTGCSGGCGTIFKIDSSGNFTTIYNFTGGSDGSVPQNIILEKNGDLYGTAEHGGAHGYGTVFKFSPSGKLKVLYAFLGQSDGAYPQDGLVLNQGVLYGETYWGGDLNCSENPGGGCGVVFEITQ